MEQDQIKELLTHLSSISESLSRISMALTDIKVHQMHELDSKHSDESDTFVYNLDNDIKGYLFDQFKFYLKADFEDSDYIFSKDAFIYSVGEDDYWEYGIDFYENFFNELLSRGEIIKKGPDSYLVIGINKNTIKTPKQ